jgi:uncharacterized protein involved in exopolysaccharide biosynthesis
LTSEEVRIAAPATSSDSDVSFVTTAASLLRGRRVLTWLAVVGGLMGLVSGLLRDRVYVSRATFLPKGSEEAASALTLAASQFGVQLPSRSGEWWPSIYVELLNSRTMLSALALDTFVVAEEHGRRAALIDLLEVRGRTPEQRAAQSLNVLREVVSATEDKKLGAVKASASTRWPSVSLALAQRLIVAVNDFNIETRRALASAERQFVDEQAGEAEKLLRQAEDRLQVFMSRNRSFEAPELRFEQGRLEREVAMRQQVFTSLVQHREQARLRELRNTPVITMIESPTLPVLPERRGAAVRAVVGVIVGIMLGMLWVLGIREVQASRASGAPGWAELSEALPKLLRRWIGV